MTMLPNSKEECIVWEQGVLEDARRMGLELTIQLSNTRDKLSKAMKLIDNLEYDPRSRHFGIGEAETAYLGFNVIRGKIII